MEIATLDINRLHTKTTLRSSQHAARWCYNALSIPLLCALITLPIQPHHSRINTQWQTCMLVKNQWLLVPSVGNKRRDGWNQSWGNIPFSAPVLDVQNLQRVLLHSALLLLTRWINPQCAYLEPQSNNNKPLKLCLIAEQNSLKFPFIINPILASQSGLLYVILASVLSSSGC